MGCMFCLQVEWLIVGKGGGGAGGRGGGYYYRQFTVDN